MRSVRRNVTILGVGLVSLASCVSVSPTQRAPASASSLQTVFVSVDDLTSLCGHEGDLNRDPELRSINLHSKADLAWLNSETHKLESWVSTHIKGEPDSRRQCQPSKKLKKGLKEMARRLGRSVDSTLNASEKEENLRALAVVAESVSTHFRYPVPRTLEGLVSPVEVIARETHYIGDGNRGPATNLDPSASDDASDNSRRDPISSTLWTRQNDISSKELYFGFNRKATSLGPNENVCSYDEPKSGYGTRPGFDMRCGKTKYKIRFGPEVHTGPFASRIFWALGFNVPVFDYVAAPRIAYDRRLLSEFNSRASMHMDITTLGVRVYRYDFQKHFDPLDFIEEAVLKDGQHVKGQELRSRLYKRPNVKNPELESGNFQESFEPLIDHLVMKHASVGPKAKNEDEIGGWDWNALDYPERREFRAAGLVAGWLNWYDERWDNNKVILVDTDNEPLLKHAITDVGSCLGDARGIGWYSGGDVNGFPWRFIEPRTRGASFGNIGLVRDYSGFDRNEAFRNLDTDDAKWITRQIAQLTEEQIKQALIVSGFSGAETKMFLEKLLYRRDNLIRVYNLQNEFPLLRPKLNPDGFAFDWNFTEEPMLTRAGDKTVAPPEGGLVIRKGVVCESKYVSRGACRKPLPAYRYQE